MQNASTVHITFDGQPMEVPAGISVAAAVLGHAHAGHTCKHPVDGSARAPYCLMGVCFECLGNRRRTDVSPASSPCGKAWL
ncbi:MAG: 2Fe-2S iron-sulfur cluster-binding protein [Bilophila wadsworthia]